MPVEHKKVEKHIEGDFGISPPAKREEGYIRRVVERQISNSAIWFRKAFTPAIVKVFSINMPVCNPA